MNTRNGTADGIRTHDLQSRSLALYPAELQPQIVNFNFEARLIILIFVRK